MTVSPVFIIGCPRSGTTLLARFLQPTHYGSPVETHFITKYYEKIPKYGALKKKQNFMLLMKDILSERPIMQWKLDIDIEEFWAGLKRYDYREIIDRLCMMRFTSKGKTSWGDKTPIYILDLEIIYRLFPDAKYLYIVKDGRDVALSLMQVPWGQTTCNHALNIGRNIIPISSNVYHEGERSTI